MQRKSTLLRSICFWLVLIAGGLLCFIEESVEAKDIADEGISVSTSTIIPGLIAYYPFEGNSNDESGNENHGTAYGGLSYAQGLLGQAANFDGVDDYIEIPDSDLLDVSETFTLAAWVKTSSVETIISKYSACPDGALPFKGTSYLFRVGSPTLPTVSINRNGNFYHLLGSLYSETSIDDGRYHFLVMTFDNGLTKRFVDGDLDKMGNFEIDTEDPNIEVIETGCKGYGLSDVRINWCGYPLDYYSGLLKVEHAFIGAENVRIGCHWTYCGGNSAPFSLLSGSVDEVRIYDRVLSEGEIKQLYEDVGTIPLMATRSHSHRYNADDNFDVCLNITHDNSVSALSVEETVPAEWSFISVNGDDSPPVYPEIGERNTLEFSWDSIPNNPIDFCYTLRVPVDESGDKNLSGNVRYSENGAAEKNVKIQPDPGIISPCNYHSLDYNPSDWSINISELQRCIQFYQEKAYHCDASGEDGFNPDIGNQDCISHDSDYHPQNWEIDLSELLRAIQLYNIGSYKCDSAGDDRYSPSSPAPNPEDMLVAHHSSDEYIPGNELTISTVIQYEGTLNAVGVKVNLPDGWTFLSAGGEDVPSILPPGGGNGDLEFAWITPPNDQLAFTYTLFVPADAVGLQPLNSQIRYRRLGGELIEPVQPSPMVFKPFGANDFIETFAIRIGGDSLLPGDEVELANHDIILVNKSHYDDINSDSWGAIKAINTDTEIYLYLTHLVNKDTDTSSVVDLNNFGRYNVSRGHSMGSLNGDHPEFFLKDSEGNRITKRSNSSYFLMEFGGSNFQDYAFEAINADYINQPWTADGVFLDHGWCILTDDNSAVPVKYNSNTEWSNAMNSMLTKLTENLNLEGQKFAGNRGFSRIEEGYDAWVALDESPDPPDMILEEAAFAVPYGAGHIQFFPELVWERQINIIALIKNSKVCVKSGTDLEPDQIGIDNYGNSLNFWDGFWFALGSYLLSKRDIGNRTYFLFLKGSNTNSSLDIYYREYDKIDLGQILSEYRKDTIDGVNIFWREFQYGYVFVNPTPYDVASISLPEPCKRRTHSNLNESSDTLPEIDEISLRSHRAAILLKIGAPWCFGDYEGDGDSDGFDLVRFAVQFDGSRLEEFAAEFGKIDCRE